MAARFGTVGKALLAVVALIGALGTAEAVPVITFDQSDNSGSLDYTSVGLALSGTGIGFDTVIVTGAPAGNGTYTCTGCFLEFTTGDLDTTTAIPGFGFVHLWDAGGTFTLTGEIDGVTGDVTLAEGTFTHASAVVNNLSGGGHDQISITGLGLDVKHAELLDFLGLTGGGFQFILNVGSATGDVTDSTDGTFSGDVAEADVTNSRVPEPSSLLLLVLGIGSLAAYRGRRS